MGGVGTALRIEATDPPAGKKRSTPRALHTAISRSILELIWNRAASVAFRDTAGNYLAQERHDGVADGLWTATPTELSWVFMDHAGCCDGSSQACYHWFDVCLVALRDRWDKMAAGRGWRICDPAQPPASALFREDCPLFGHGQQPLCVPRFRMGQVDWDDEWGGPFWDQGSPRPKLANFGGRHRAGVIHAAITGMCRCELCQRLHPWGGDRSPVAVLQAAWIALAEQPDLVPVAAEVTREVRQYGDWRRQPAGPPSLQVLRDQLCERLPLDAPHPWELAGMCVGLR